MSRLRRTIALVSLLAFLALSTIGAGWVVCAGADGHVAIEALDTGCCGDESPANDHDDDERDCGDCSDVLLAQLNPARDADSDPMDVGPSSSALRARDAMCALRSFVAPPVHAPRGPPRPPPIARHLATTVLRL